MVYEQATDRQRSKPISSRISLLRIADLCKPQFVFVAEAYYVISL